MLIDPSIDFKTIQRVAIYLFARCNAWVCQYQKLEAEGNITFQQLPSWKKDYPNSGWTANFIDNISDGEFLPDAFIGADLVVCLTSWAGSDSHNLHLVEAIKQDQSLYSVPVLICQGLKEEFNGVPRKDRGLTPEMIALREELIKAGRYLPPLGSWDFDTNESQHAIAILRQLFTGEIPEDFRSKFYKR